VPEAEIASGGVGQAPVEGQLCDADEMCLGAAIAFHHVWSALGSQHPMLLSLVDQIEA
jgi:hypothetical protein